MSVYEFVFGHQNPLHGNPYELNRVELMTEQKEREAREGIRLFKLMMEDKAVLADTEIPKYVTPEAMPDVNGLPSLKVAVDVWRSIRLAGELPTYDTIIDKVRRKGDDVITETVVAIVDECKKLDNTNFETTLLTDTLKQRMLSVKLKDLMKRDPMLFVAKNIDVSDSKVVETFLADTYSMEYFFRHLDETKKNVDYVMTSIKQTTNPADYE